MRNILIILTFCFVLIQTNNTNAQGNPCPCDCDEILSTNNNDNQLIMERDIFNPNCYNLYLTLNACGGRTIFGFSVTIPKPNCFEDKEIEVFMNDENLGIVDLANTAIPPFFSLEEPILPCTSRRIEFKFCFPNQDGNDCENSASGIENAYNIGVNMQFDEHNEPCETQFVDMFFDYPLISDVNEEISFNQLFEIEKNTIIAKSNYNIESITIYNLQGSKVKTSFSNTIEISDLKSGAYIIVAKAGNNYYKSSYIIQN